MTLLVYCTKFRPRLGQDLGEQLCLGLERRGHEIGAVLGAADDDAWMAICARRGWRFVAVLPEFGWPYKRWQLALRTDAAARARLEAWLEVVRGGAGQASQTGQAATSGAPGLGISFFGSWLPDPLLALPQRGFINFHPGPLPELPGFFPEDLALLWGWPSMGGTVHRVGSGIDDGPILKRCRKAPLTLLDTPDSAMQRIAAFALPDIWRIVDRLATGSVRGRTNRSDQGFDASYEALYSLSRVDWAKDSHTVLDRKFRVFRGQAHRMLLKASWEGREHIVWDWELHRGYFAGMPGEMLGTLPGTAHLRMKPVVVRTSEGLAVVWDYEDFAREEAKNQFIDRRSMADARVLPPAPVFCMASETQLAEFRA